MVLGEDMSEWEGYSVEELHVFQDAIELSIMVVEKSRDKEDALEKLRMIQRYIIERKIDVIKEKHALII